MVILCQPKNIVFLHYNVICRFLHIPLFLVRFSHRFGLTVAPVLHLLKEPGHSYIFLALGNSGSVNVILALYCFKNYPMFASSVATSSSCCIFSEIALNYYQCIQTNRIEMLESFIIHATSNDLTVDVPCWFYDNASNFCLLSVSGFSQPYVWACQLHWHCWSNACYSAHLVFH